jgi:ferredoxin, 2Fe-2S
MISIRFIHPDATQQDILARPGDSLMKAAVDANVKGIEADCGGSLTCATCHVMIDAPWSELLPAPVPDELDMLDFASSPVVPQSRLSCQVRLSAELDGLVVRLPASQH